MPSPSICTSVWCQKRANNGDTYRFENLGVDFSGRDVAVILEEFAACRVNIYELFVVPRNVFEISILFDLTVRWGGGHRHCATEGSGGKEARRNSQKESVFE